jgi:hypothetical protein
VSEIYGSSRDDSGDHRDPASSSPDRYTPADQDGGDGLSEDTGPADYDPDIYAILYENDHLPEPRTRQDAARDAHDLHSHDYDEDEDYSEDPDTANYAFLAENGRFPTWQEAASQDGAGYETNDASPDDRYLGHTGPDTAAILAEEDKLPTREESRAATRGDHPAHHDETDLVSADTENPETVSTAEPECEGDPLTGTDPGQADVARGDYPYPEHAVPDQLGDQPGHADSTHETRGDQQSTDQDSETSAELRQRIADLESETVQLRSGMAEVKAENAEIRSESAELRRDFSELRALVEWPEHGGSDKTLAVDTSRELSHAENADEKKQQSVRRRVWTSNEAFGIAAMAGGTILTGVADYWRYLPGTYAGIAANVLGLGAAAVALIRKNKEVRDAAHRSGH